MAKMLAKNHELFFYNRSEGKSLALQKELGGEVCNSGEELLEKAQWILLGVKPKDFQSIADQYASSFTKDHYLISILAGMDLKVLRKHFSEPVIFATMPNLPVSCGKGVVGVVDDPQTSEKDKSKMATLFKDLGSVQFLPGWWLCQ